MQMYWYNKYLTQRNADGEVIPGVYFPAFVHNFDYHLTNIVAYKDGMVECWGLVPFEEFKAKVRDGWVVTSIPEGAIVTIHHVGRFTVSNVSIEGPEEELVKDVANAIEELNGRPTAQERLIQTIRMLREQVTPEVCGQFREAFAALPAYCRKYVFGSRMEKYTDLQKLLHENEL